MQNTICTEGNAEHIKEITVSLRQYFDFSKMFDWRIIRKQLDTISTLPDDEQRKNTFMRIKLIWSSKG